MLIKLQETSKPLNTVVGGLGLWVLIQHGKSITKLHTCT